MALIGIALLPPPEVSQRLIDFQGSYTDVIAGPRLGLDVNLPHTSVLQCPFTEELDKSRVLEVLVDFLEDFNPRMVIGDLFYQPESWIFAKIESAPWLHQLQRAALAQCEPFIDRSRIQDRTEANLTDQEKRSYDRYGYRYIGECYRPHITLGRTSGEKKSLPAGLGEAFINSGIFGMAYRPAAIAFYRAGESGAFAESLDLIDL